jgi:hypothetical protein
MPAAADRQRAMTDRPMQPTVHAAAEQASGNRGADLVERIPAGRAARILAFSAGAGLLAQLLFVGQQPGINLGLWVSAVLGAALLTRRPDASLDRLDAWLPLAALTFGWLPALRDDLSLQLFNVPAAAGLTLASTGWSPSWASWPRRWPCSGASSLATDSTRGSGRSVAAA